MIEQGDCSAATKPTITGLVKEVAGVIHDCISKARAVEGLLLPQEPKPESCDEAPIEDDATNQLRELIVRSRLLLVILDRLGKGC